MKRLFLIMLVLLTPYFLSAKPQKVRLLNEVKEDAQSVNLEVFYKRKFNKKYPQEKLNKILLGLDSETVDDVRVYYTNLQSEKASKKAQIDNCKNEKDVEAILGAMTND